MLKIENVEVLGWEHVIRGMRNPKNSWARSDSFFWDAGSSINEAWGIEKTVDDFGTEVHIGPNDYTLMKSLAEGGPVHAKYRRMITVYLDITAPLYWWKEFDTYKVGTVANSCSSMHKIHSKEFTLEDFSTEHLFDGDNPYFIKGRNPLGRLKDTIEELNFWRLCFIDEEKALGNSVMLNADGNPMDKKEYWWQMIQLLPTSYNQKRTVMLNYEVLANIYQWRRNHKLDEWHVVCDWIESLPYSELITGKKENE